MSDNDLPSGNGYGEGKGWIRIILDDHTGRLTRLEEGQRKALEAIGKVAAASREEKGKMSVWTAIWLGLAMSLTGAIITVGVSRTFPRENQQVEALTAAINRLSERQAAIEKAGVTRIEDRR